MVFSATFNIIFQQYDKKNEFLTCKHIVNETFIGETIYDPYEIKEC